MDLAEISEREFTQPLRDAITDEDMIATRRLINSVEQESNITDSKQEVKVYAMKYVLSLRDGTQSQQKPTVEKIQEWISAKGLEGTLNAYAVLNSILENGTTWDRVGGSIELQSVINKDNVKRVLDIAVKEEANKILRTKWLSR
jgi:hypothetical protein